MVTIFLQSLAESGHPGIAVILSGMDSDGAATLKIFHAHGGIVIVQDLSTAERPDMPTAAVKTGYVDYMLRPERIAAQLRKIAERFRSWSLASAVQESL